MAKTSKFLVTGIPQIDKAIKDLEANLVLKSIRKVLREEQKKTIQPKIKQEIPKDKGILKKNVKIKAQKRSTKSVGVDTQIIDTKHAVPVEFGHGSKQPDGTWRKVYDSNKDDASKHIQKNILKKVEEEVKKAGKKNK